MQCPVDRTGVIEGARRARPNANSVDALFAEAYQELRRLARVRLRGGGRNTVLDTTSLVHESYLRLAAAGRLRVEDRAHFLRYAGCAMRSVIVDFVRQRQSGRRGGAADRITLTTRAGAGVNAGERQILRVHEAISELARYDARMARVVEMRYFGGLTESEIAEALEVTDRTVRRDWEKARLWLSDALKYCPQPRPRWNHVCVRSPLQSSADGPGEVHHAALRSAFDLFDGDGSRMVASALGEFPAARRGAGSDERSPHHVVERSTYAAGDCAVFIEGLPRGGTPGRW